MMTCEQNADTIGNNTKAMRGIEFNVGFTCWESTASGSQRKQQIRKMGVSRAKSDKKESEFRDDHGRTLDGQGKGDRDS